MDLVFDIKKGFSRDKVDSKSLVLLTESDDQPNNREVLSPLMKAIKLSEHNSDIVVVKADSMLKLSVGYDQILLFGYDKTQHLTNMDLHLNQIYQLEQSRLLCTHSLGALREDTDKKKKLWVQLQKMFLS